MSDPFPKVPANSAPSLPQAMNGEIYAAVGKYARSAVLYAFENLGGGDGLTDWAQKNPDEFYTKLFPKIIARESEVTHHRTVDQLMDVIDADWEVDDAVIDDDDITDRIPYFQQGSIEPIAHNWNAGDADMDDQDILSEAAFEPAFDPADLVDFEDT